MGLDCDLCDRSNLHQFWTLENGCEVCAVCHERVKSNKAKLKKYRQELVVLKQKSFDLKRKIDSLNAKLSFTPDQIETGKRRKKNVS